MATLGDFLTTLFDEGLIVLDGRPAPVDADRPAALQALEAAFDVHGLDVAGPPIAFDAHSAMAAAELLRLSAWFLVNRSEPNREVERSLVPPGPRSRPASTSPPTSASGSSRSSSAGPDRWPRGTRWRGSWPGCSGPGRSRACSRTWTKAGGRRRPRQSSGPLVALRRAAAADPKPAWMPKGKPRGHVELVFTGLGLGKSPLLGSHPAPSEVGGMSVG